jgi:hypothetical protein
VFAAPLVLPVVLLDVPLMLYAAAWYREGSLLDPDRFSSIAYWADFMNADGRFVLTIAAVVLAVFAASASGSRSRT